MTLQDYINKYNNKSFTDVKEMTAFFNELQIDERQVFLEGLEKTEFDSFVNKIRQ